MTPLQRPLELGSEPFDPGGSDNGVADNGGFVNAIVATVVRSHDPGKGVGQPLGQRVCWFWGGAGLMTPNQHGVRRCATTQYPKAEALLTQLGLCSKPAVEPDAPLPTLDSDGGEVTLGLPCKVSPDGMKAIPKLYGVDHRIQRSLGVREAEGGRPPFEQ